MTQLALTLDFPRARSRDPATSHKAAKGAARFATGHFALILVALLHGPATFKEIAWRCNLERHAVARRLKELETGGLIRRSRLDDGSQLERDGCCVWERA